MLSPPCIPSICNGVRSIIGRSSPRLPRAISTRPPSRWKSIFSKPPNTWLSSCPRQLLILRTQSSRRHARRKRFPFLVLHAPALDRAIFDRSKDHGFDQQADQDHGEQSGEDFWRVHLGPRLEDIPAEPARAPRNAKT